MSWDLLMTVITRESEYERLTLQIAQAFRVGNQAEAMALMARARFFGSLAKTGMLGASFALKLGQVKINPASVQSVELSAQSCAEAIAAEGPQAAEQAAMEMTKRSPQAWQTAAKLFGRFAGPLVVIMTVKTVYDMGEQAAMQVAAMQIAHKIALHDDYTQEYFTSVSVERPIPQLSRVGGEGLHPGQHPEAVALLAGVSQDRAAGVCVRIAPARS